MKTILSCLVAFVASSLGHVEHKVFGGLLATENQFPHQVSLLELGTHRCGGVIIDELHVLTAAECLKNNPKKYEILAGTNWLDSNLERLKVENFIIHEGFRLDNKMFNIAVMKLEKPLKFSDSVKSIEIFKEDVPANAVITISGWLSAPSNEFTKHLRYNTLITFSDETCKKRAGLSFNGIICFYYKNGYGVSDGDQGGAAIYNNKLVGIINCFPFGCPFSTSLDVYAKASFFNEWIRNTTIKLSA